MKRIRSLVRQLWIENKKCREGFDAMRDRVPDGTVMQLNINNPQAHKVAKLLAEETGETISVAVTKALREHRDRVLFERPIRRATLLK